MLDYELGRFCGNFVRSGLAEWRREVAERAGKPARERNFRDHLGQAFRHAETYVLASAYTALVFLVRVLALLLALPVGVNPLFILLPGAALLGVAVCILAATFKKYL
ncbi:MAG: DUF4400 domain-containing protein [Candidatus Accumulibacter sp.]|jgi:hypothetical protein|nr:DUF4400 domain-containing protein [Accumulibacter sp.]